MGKQFKSFISFLIILAILISTPSFLLANKDDEIKVELEGNRLEFEVAPQIIEGRTLLPLREIFEALNLIVGWDNSTKVITGKGENVEITLKVDSIDAIVNGKNVTLDVPAKVVEGRTLVPVRFISESLGLNVDWIQKTKTVIINSKDIIRWEYEGYEKGEPYKEYERKYLNGKKTEETRYNGKNHVVESPKQEGKKANKYPHVLSEQDIREAIRIGEGGFDNALKYTQDNYSLTPIASSNNIFIEDTQIITPNHYIVRQAAMGAAKFNNYKFEKAKEIAGELTYGEILNFDILYLGSEIDSHKNVVIVLKQGDNIFHPMLVTGKNEFANMTHKWPNFPAYKALLNVNFSNALSENKIDFSKPVQLIISHAPDMNTVYDINFSDFK